jgi:hypothetical protein
LGQQIYVAGVHLFAMRIVILLGLLRGISFPSSGNGRLAGGWNSIDTCFFLFVVVQVSGVLINTPSSDALINQSAYMWDFIGGYTLFRILVQEESDVTLAIKTLSCISVIIAIGMLGEQQTRINMFGLLGGVARSPEVRDGRIRSQGVFQHALTAGAFATMAFPMFLLLVKRKKDWVLGLAGMLSTTIMAFSTATSTSVLSFLAAIIVILVWPISNFGQWWLIGTNTNSWGWDMWDVQNEYVAVGVTGGLVAFGAFIYVIYRSFSRIGIKMKLAQTKEDQWFLWLLGGSLFVEVVSFFGVNFYDQVRMLWFVLLAMIVAATRSIEKVPIAVGKRVPSQKGLSKKRLGLAHQQ